MKALLGSMNAPLIDDLLLTADRKWSMRKGWRCKISADKLIQQPPLGSPFDLPTVAIAVIRVNTIITIDYYHGMDASRNITCQKSVVGF